MHALVLVLIVVFSNPTVANIYNPSFVGGIGCGTGSSIDNNCTAVQRIFNPSHATNGAGVICYDTAIDCNSNCAQKSCYPDVSTCATGYAGGYIKLVWVCPSDPSLFTATSIPAGLPNGKGGYCFASISDCQLAINNTGTCVLDMATCSTGQAGPTALNYIASLDAPSVSTGLPNGAGILCFDTEAHCEASNNNPCIASGGTPCTQDATNCATGQAAPLGVTYTCGLSYPPGALANGGGQYCYDSFADCIGGPNACSDSAPCMWDPATCSTGAAGPTPDNWFCPSSMPANSLPNGGGQLCYATTADCVNGPNACNSSSTCVFNAPTCSTGVVGPTPKNTFCAYDQPMTRQAAPSTPGSLPDASGVNCYFTQSDCLNGPNACSNPATECMPDFTTCGTGQAGPTPAWSVCAKDFAAGSLPDGGGQLCYDNAYDCFAGPNPCDARTPCVLDYPVCSTGVAGPSPDNYYCEQDTPAGYATGVPALPSGAGLLCWDSVTDCVDGPNACTAAAGDCAQTNASTRFCNTGLAASNPVGNNVACAKDVPTGAVANAAGKWCYDTPSNCANGTNACNASAYPCVAAPAAVCATAGAAYPYFCALDYPFANLSKGVSASGELCYRTPDACILGPNPCNISFLCASDTALTGACKGASYPWYCTLKPPTATTINTPTSTPASAAALARPSATPLILLYVAALSATTTAMLLTAATVAE